MSHFNYQKISQIEWYQQGVASSPFFIYNPYRCTQIFAPTFVHSKGFINTGYFDKQKEGQLARKYLVRQKKNPRFVNQWITTWRKVAKIQMRLLKIIDQPHFIKCSDKGLAEFLRKVAEITKEFWLKAVLIEFYDPWGDTLIQEEIKQSSKVKLNPDGMRILTAPFKLSFIQEELLSRYALLIMIKKDKKLQARITKIHSTKGLKQLKAFPQFYQQLKTHTHNFYWFSNSWIEAFSLNECDFLKKIKKDLQNFNKTRIQARELRNYEKNIQKEKQKIISTHKLPKDLVTVFNFFSILADWRDERKKYALIYVHYLNEIIKELAKRNKVKMELLKFALPQEIKSWSLPQSYLKTLKERFKECFGYVDIKGQFHWLSRLKAAKILKALQTSFRKYFKEIKGMAAYPGKAKGKVKIIEISSEFNKMKRGDILVAKMTRPEFLPVMKKAAAILTDEGGITCHAAIVSRELKIPCIVGTQIATQVLKNGDLVEVDANRGVVRKI